jgi:hypothetical protein
MQYIADSMDRQQQNEPPRPFIADVQDDREGCHPYRYAVRTGQEFIRKTRQAFQPVSQTVEYLSLARQLSHCFRCYYAQYQFHSLPSYIRIDRPDRVSYWYSKVVYSLTSSRIQGRVLWLCCYSGTFFCNSFIQSPTVFSE